MRRRARLLSYLCAAGMAAMISACASGEKQAEGPAQTKAPEQQAQTQPAKPAAAAPAPAAAAPAPAAAAPAPAPQAAAVQATPAGPAKPATPPPAPVAAAAVDVAEFEIIRFEFDKSDILPQYRNKLEEEAALLKTGGTRLMVEGHCDEQGTEDYNMALGDRRASNVKRYLASLGVADKNIDTISYGEERPVDKRHNVEAWKKNRRVQFSPAK